MSNALAALTGADVFTDAPECRSGIERLCAEAELERDRLVHALALARAALRRRKDKDAAKALDVVEWTLRRAGVSLEPGATPEESPVRIAVVVRDGAVAEVNSDRPAELLLVDCDVADGSGLATFVDDDSDVPCNPTLYELRPAPVSRWFSGSVLRKAPVVVSGARTGG